MSEFMQNNSSRREHQKCTFGQMLTIWLFFHANAFIQTLPLTSDIHTYTFNKANKSEGTLVMIAIYDYFRDARNMHFSSSIAVYTWALPTERVEDEN